MTVDYINQSSEFFSFTPAGWIVPTFSASVSLLFSILVTSFILRSEDLSSSYHRIMLFMSSWDVASSLAIALTTLLMPTDVFEVYPFAGGAFGNTLTCTCQGLIIFVGGLYVIWSNCTLNIYYVCAIRYGISNETVNKRILPFMLAISTFFIGAFSYVCLSMEFFNPRPFEPICYATSYPYNCFKDDAVECIRGDISLTTNQLLVKVMVVTIGVSFLFVVVSMGLVVAAVLKTEISTRRRYGRENVSLVNTRTAFRQAMMYIAAFILTWVWLGIGVASGSDEPLALINPLKLFFLPLQGFFNASIFFSHKASILRKTQPNLTRFAALRQTIRSPSNVPRVLVSQIGAMDNEDGLPSHSFHDDNDGGGDRDDDAQESVSMPSNSTPSLDFSRAMISVEDETIEEGKNQNEESSSHTHTHTHTRASPRLSANFREAIQSLEDGKPKASSSSGPVRSDEESPDIISKETSIFVFDTSKIQRRGILSGIHSA